MKLLLTSLSILIFSISAAVGKPQPLIIAHRAGTADAPENTLLAIKEALNNGADAIWLSVQLSRDGVPVLYRPADLSALTEGSGTVASKTLSELKKLNAGWHFKPAAMSARQNCLSAEANNALPADELASAVKKKSLPSDNLSSQALCKRAQIYPYRDRAVPIATLQEALTTIPPAIPIFLDLKALPTVPLAHAVARVLTAQRAWQRVRIYSTESAYRQAFQIYPQAQLFEDRNLTRTRLLKVALADVCEAPPEAGTWVGFEFKRKLEVVERYTLGEARLEVIATLWNSRTLACFHSQPKVHIVLFGINSVADFAAAKALGVDAVMVDSPALISKTRRL